MQKKVVKLFKELGFKSLLKKLPNDDWEEEVEAVFKEKKKVKKIKKEDNKQIGLF